MKLIIIEDEIEVRQSIKNLIYAEFKDIQIVGESDSVASSIALIKATAPDILLMDIQLIDGNSFEILDHIAYKNLHIIFLTAYSEFAINAFKYAAIDYILKPFESKQLIAAIDKIKKQTTNTFANQYKLLAENIKASQLNKKIAIQTTEGFTILKINDIIRFQSESNYTHIFSTNTKEIMSAKSLASYNDILENSCFERVHQSHLVNTEHISKYIHKDGGYIILSDGSTVPVSQRKKAHLIELIENMFNKSKD
jgi:two-component system, LytTR family, response regulator